MARLPSRLMVDLLLRAVAAQGGFGAVLQSGDDDRGALLVQLLDRGNPVQISEWSVNFDGIAGWQVVGPAPDDQTALNDYVARRRCVDPDLWVIELDIADPARFIAQSFSLT